ncbi:MAG: Lin0512 family protein [Pseudomonadales bacterium]|nr:Lin0512 family protein [Pseudomonadales bacterium]
MSESHKINKNRYITEFGMGVDVHGKNYTLAAERAVFDAIHHSSLNFFKTLKKSPREMLIDVLIGSPNPDMIDTSKVEKALPYGTVSVKTELGGLEIPSEDGKDAIVIVNAGVIVHFLE